MEEEVFEAVYAALRKVYPDMIVGCAEYGGAAIFTDEQEDVVKAVKEITGAEDVGVNCVSLEIGEGYNDTVRVCFPKKLPFRITVPGGVVDNLLDGVGLELYSVELSDDLKTYPGGEKLLGRPFETEDHVPDKRLSSAVLTVCRPAVNSSKWEYFICPRTGPIETLSSTDRIKEVMEALGIGYSEIFPENARICADDGARELIERRLDGI